MRSRLMVSAVLAAAVLGGCNKEETPNNGPSTKPSTPKAATQPAAVTPAPVIPSGTSPTVTTPTIATSTTPDAASTDAAKKMSEISQMISEKKYDQADKALKDLEGKKSSLSAEMRTGVDGMRQMLDLAKSGALDTTSVPTTPTRPPTTAPSGK